MDQRHDIVRPGPRQEIPKAVRSYTDAEGTTWMVYLVSPATLTSQHLLPGDYKTGWLCFEAGDLKRRLVPVPPDWEDCDRLRLDGYLKAAAVAGRRLAPTSDGRNAPVGTLSSELRQVEHFFARRLPSSLSLALDRFADRLNEPDAPAESRPAVADLRLAAQDASRGDFDGARERYRAAAVFFATMFEPEGSAVLGLEQRPEAAQRAV